ncbi:hypothetical protein DAPPUDRAFT_268210 [Daphnia pulex]|uniref:Ionotropic glutamate receptor L-glutamate and glycine-binding domain-containing protein n=1 Tax=Daphnia pulex TaxID=6669 RepID=E9HXE9_DAPPU|nr:hypothetical protein DAPPUDRAFT_268210 [Daphnia pulex]|eukprot:EFX63582.1 hypothetical protein DAPPUDRAFT_268210 [Daphnia pulex]
MTTKKTFFVITNCFSPAEEGNISPKIFRSSLQGKELRIVTGHFPPVISILRNSSGHIIGYSDQLYLQFLYLAKKLKFAYKISPAAENTNGVKINGSWNGIIGALTKGEADFGLVPVAVSLERYEAIEFCGRVGGDYTGILIKYPEGSNFPTNQFKQQKLLAAVWCFVAFVFVNIYNSTLTSYMSVRYQKPVVNSFHDLAAIPSYQATILTGSIQDMDLLVSLTTETNLEYMKVIYEKIKKCSSDCRKFTFPEMVNPVVQKDNYVSIIVF